MREIKFRGISAEPSGNWVYGSLVICDNGDYQIGSCPKYGDIYYRNEVFPDSVGQYTGLKDKNGKEIYEGDIVLDHEYSIPCRCIVRYGIANIPCCGCCYEYHKIIGFYLEDKKGEIEPLDENTIDKLEVIGNIYENKELIEDERIN